MATTHGVIEAIQINNVSPVGQTITISVKPFPTSTLFIQSGQIKIKSQAQILVEEDRIDKQQIISLSNKGLVTFTTTNIKGPTGA